MHILNTCSQHLFSYVNFLDTENLHYFVVILPDVQPNGHPARWAHSGENISREHKTAVRRYETASGKY